MSFWERGTSDPGLPSLIRIAQLFDVSVDWLLGLDDVSKDTRGRIKSGDAGIRINTVPLADMTNEADPSLADVNVKGVIQTINSYKPGTAVAIRVNGDAMRLSVPEGSYAIISNAHLHKSGSVVAANVGGAIRAQMLRKYIEEGEKKMLLPDDPRFPTIDMADKKVRIVGVVVEVVTMRLLA